MGLHALLASERLGALTSRVREAFGEAMARHGMLCVEAEGDVLIGVSGAPRVAERHAERACHAAHDAIQAVVALAADTGAQIGLRVGVHTARLVSGCVGSTRACYSVWGEAHTHADRLQRLAPLHGALVSEQTLEAAMGASALHRRIGEHGRRPLAFTSHAEDGSTYVLAVPPLAPPGPAASTTA